MSDLMSMIKCKKCGNILQPGANLKEPWLCSSCLTENPNPKRRYQSVIGLCILGLIVTVVVVVVEFKKTEQTVKKAKSESIDMTVIDKIKSKLKNYPQLSWNTKDNHISIEPPSESGFSVWLSVNDVGFTVGYDGWHEEFDNENDALNCFAFGLSDECRLKVVKRGKTECAWIVEAKKGEKWEEDSTTGQILIPFWQKKSVEYRQNNIIKSI